MRENMVRCEALEATFGSIGRGLVAALRKGYDTACEHHDPGKGDNSKTFGYCLYYYALHEIRNSPEEKDGRLEVVSIDPIFRFKVGEFELACHRVPNGDIWESFPRNDGAVGEMVDTGLWLPGFEPESEALDLEDVRKVVLVHQGGPEDGFVAAHVCIPIRLNSAGQIEEWGYVMSLSDPEDVRHATPEDDLSKTPPESIGDVPVRRKRKLKSNDGE